MLVPGGFGERGVEGMVVAAKWAREKGIPYFGAAQLESPIITHTHTHTHTHSRESYLHFFFPIRNLSGTSDGGD